MGPHARERRRRAQRITGSAVCKGLVIGLPATTAPISSYHSLVTEGFERKTDEEWAELLEKGPMKRPAWTDSFVR